MRSISHKEESRDSLSFHGAAHLRIDRSHSLRFDYEERAARTIPLRRIRLPVVSRRRLRRRLVNVSAAALEKTYS